MIDDHPSDWDFETEFADALESVPEEYVDPDRFVPGVGPLTADVMLVGEAPGKREVTEGKPFVGQAGTQLNRTLESIGVDRRDLYITNLVKIRPPDNRDPYVEEIAAWWPVLETEIDRVDPTVVVPLGSVATGEFLGTDETITERHGQRFEYEERTVVPSFHPAAALYDRSKVDALESDLSAALEVG